MLESTTEKCRLQGVRALASALEACSPEMEASWLRGSFPMVYILPERLPALVRPAFDLVLRRIRSLKRCVEA